MTLPYLFPTPASPTTGRLFTQFQKSVGKDALKSEKMARECRAAIAEVIEAFLDTCEPEQVANFFVTVELASSAAKRKKIETHPMRPGTVTGRVTAELAKREALRVQEEREAQAPADAAKGPAKSAAGLGDTAVSM